MMLNSTQIFYSRITKRFFDVFTSLILIVLFSPILLITSFIVVCIDGFPIIHKRECLGESRKLFYMLKFRTMIEDADIILEQWKQINDKKWIDYQKNIKLGNDPRIIFLGKFLRQSSIDELPQLFNVLLGTMSLIGPRPIAESEEEKINKENLLIRYKVRPGITGLWQVSGRQDVSYDQRQKLDAQYVENISLFNDIIIFFKTFLVVFKTKGAL